MSRKSHNLRDFLSLLRSTYTDEVRENLAYPVPEDSKNNDL
nr:8087_t:CDS:2 [Entrophospora candida]